MFFYVKVIELVMLSTIFVLGIYLMTGLTGLFSLGQGAFVSLGAYTAAIAVLQFNMPPMIAILLAILMGVVGGLVVGIPTLKLRMDYFLLVTFGFGEMVRALLIWMAQLTGGAMGIAGIPQVVGLPLISASLVVILFLVGNLKRTRFGRDCLAIRDDDLAARTMGINVYSHKLKVFILSSVICSYGGALYAFNIMFIDPNLFDWLESAKLIIIVFVGGVNSLTGALITSLSYYVFGELFRFFSVWRDVVLAFIVIVLVIYRRKGIFGDWELSPRWIGSLFSKAPRN